MGLNIDRDELTEHDFVRFRTRLDEQLEMLAGLIAEPGFGRGEATLGAELEMHLVDEDMHPCPRNLEVLEACADPRVTLELNRFNLELNARYTALKGRPFAFLRAELEDGLGCIERAARQSQCRPAIMGILPTLRKVDLGPHSRTNLPRYNLLSRVLRERRGAPFEVRINGRDPLWLECDDVTLEGANTAWQLHLRVEPQRFADMYNAAQLATPVVLAVSGNSPLFLGHRLWEETRIALFKQAVDARLDLHRQTRRPARVCLGHGWIRKGALELFRQSVLLHEPLLPICAESGASGDRAAGKGPTLGELRLHHGSVWSWNRAVYDPAADGHLRIELRALPAGPTLVDMLANSAFALGLTFRLAQDAERWTCGLPFENLRHNLYRSAEQGLAAELLWPTASAPSPRTLSAKELALELLPVAAEGLSLAGVASEDYEPLLETLRARIVSGQTGACWQRAEFERRRQREPLDVALAGTLARYLELSSSQRPVHEW